MEQKKKTGKKLGIALAVTIPVLILAAFVGTYFVTYSSAGKALDRRDHEGAKKLLFLKDATKLHDPNIIKYIEALETEANGDHETAIDLFRALGDYKESDTIQKEIRYRLAEEKRGAGSYDEACGIFAALRGEGYGDSADQVILTKLK